MRKADSMGEGGNMKKTTILILSFILLYALACNGPRVERGIRYVLQPRLAAGLEHLTYETVTRLHELGREAGIDLAETKVHQQNIIITGIDPAHQPRLHEIIATNLPQWQAEAAKNQLVISLRESVKEALQMQMLGQLMVALRTRLAGKSDLYPVLQQLGPPPQSRILVTFITDKDLAPYNLFRFQGVLEFCPVLDGPFKSKAELEARYNQGIRADLKAVESKNRQWFLINRWPVVSGRDIVSARRDTDHYGSAAVGITFNDTAAKKLEVYSKSHIGKMLAIVLDGRIYSAPRLEGPISRQVQITGRFTENEVEDLARILKSGALPVPLKLLEERKIVGEMEFEQGIVIEFTLETAHSMAQVRQKLDQMKLENFMLQQTDGGHLFLNLINLDEGFNRQEFEDKITAALGSFNMVAVDAISSPTKL
jgi:protein-export membrane protein SecD